jgi:nucleoside phosphorylase
MNRARIETVARLARLIFELERKYWGVFGGPITFESFDGRGKRLRQEIVAAAKLLKLELPDSGDLDPRRWATLTMDALRIEVPESEALIEATYLLGYVGASGTDSQHQQAKMELERSVRTLLGKDADLWLRRLPRFPREDAFLELVDAACRGQSPEPRPELDAVRQTPHVHEMTSSAVANIRGNVDFVIVTIKKEEFEAIQKRIAVDETISGRREWNIGRMSSNAARRDVVIATVRQRTQGNIEGALTVSDAIEDLDPAYILVVGIAGAIPGELTLGDVVFGMHVHDLTVQDVRQDGSRVFSTKGGGIETGAQTLLANLSVSLPKELNDLGLPKLPPLDLAAPIEGDEQTQNRIRKQLRARYGDAPNALVHPYFTDGEIASSDTLVKYVDLVHQWMTFAKHLKAVEMESAGAYHASRTRGGKQYPVIPIRAISDVIGLKREDAWTLYACDVAAAFALAFIRTVRLPARNPLNEGAR